MVWPLFKAFALCKPYDRCNDMYEYNMKENQKKK